MGIHRWRFIRLDSIMALLAEHLLAARRCGLLVKMPFFCFTEYHTMPLQSYIVLGFQSKPWLKLPPKHIAYRFKTYIAI